MEMSPAANPAADPQCIYCLEREGPFTAEHVIPEAFGLFGTQTLVLNDAVCNGCNQKFGGTLDLVLARDSYEGLLRADIFPRADGRGDRFRPRRTVMRFPDEPQFEQFRGLRLEVDWAIRRPRFLDQIVVLDDGGKRHTFTLDEVRGADPSLFQNRPPNAIQIVATSAEAATALKQEAEALGARIRLQSDLELPAAVREPSVVLEVEGLIDLRVRRAIAKIAFNYLALTQGPAFVLGRNFDEIREFIRGDGKSSLVRLSVQPILANETRRWRQHEMHLVLVERDQREIRGRVSLFNSFSYDIRLCRDSAVWYPLRSGHAFDPIERQVHKLTAMPRWLWLPRMFRR
jgi:hypothetical protein